MQSPPKLTDRPALTRNRRRADTFFLHEIAIQEIKERLSEVNRTFTDMTIVTGFPSVWGPAFPAARLISDSETLALEAGSCDLIVHAMALHWSGDPVGQLVQCRHALRPDGLFLSAAFGGQTLHQLRSALAEAETQITGGLSPRVAPMAEIRELGGLVQRAGLALPVADSIVQTVSYRDMFQLMHDLRAMGEANALEARLRHPTRRSIFNRAAEIYSGSFAQDGRIPASFELIFLAGWSPDDNQQKPLRPGSARARLADALGTVEKPLGKTGKI